MSDVIVIEDLLDVLRNIVACERKKHPGKVSEAVLAVILSNINALQRRIEEDETERAVALAIHTMAILAHHNFMFKWPKWFKEADRIKRSNYGAVRTHDIEPTRVRQLVDELLLRSDMSRTAAYKKIAKQELGKEEAYKTISRRYNEALTK